MSWVATPNALAKENKKIRKERHVEPKKKVRKCHFCKETAVGVVDQGLQKFHLCRNHFEIYANRGVKHSVIFTNAKSWFD